jgi:hypothetical protein
MWWLCKGESVSRSQMEVKTAVMDEIGFLFVSLGNSTVQLHDSLGSRHARACSEAGFSSQKGDCLRYVLLKSSILLCVFCGQKDSMERIFIKKCFMFMVGSVYHVKQFTTDREILSRTFKSCRWCSTRCRSGWGNSQKFRISHVLHFISICNLFTDSPSYLWPK